MSLEELRKDSEEFSRLLEQETRVRVKNALVAGKAEVDKEIVTLELKKKLAEEAKLGINSDSTPKRYTFELNEYAWDQSDKFVKLFVALDGIQNIPEDNVTVLFKSNSVTLSVDNLNNKNYGLTINNLLENIDIEKSYRKVKTGMIAIYMKKEREGVQWSELTTIHKRLNQKRDAEMKGDPDASEDALMNIMKKMYNSGDGKTKQMIAKAWTESQEKVRHGGGGPDAMPF